MQDIKDRDRSQDLKLSSIEANLTLTNAEMINNSRFSHYQNIPINGNLIHAISGDPYPNYSVSVKVNGELFPRYNATTDEDGNFTINYNISDSLNIYTSHKIEAEVLNDTESDIDYLNHYIIFLNTTSEFDIDEGDWSDTDIPYLTGEPFNTNGYLRYVNGTGIAGGIVNFYWYHDGEVLDSGTTSTNNNGEINSLPIPETELEELSLKLNFSDFPYVNYSEWILPETIEVFSNISCQWDVESTSTEFEDFTIQGTLVSSANSSFFINDRQIALLYNGELVGQVSTNSDGSFSYTYNIPEGTGANNLQIRLINDAGKIETSNSYTIEVYEGEEEAVVPPDDTEDDTPAPFVNFFIYFIPIVAGIIVALTLLGYKYLRQQEEASRTVKVPLGDKLLNLKMLKESGRLEEALSYLFNAIYMDLINAKFGRSKKASETIRDIAIVSVKDLKLPPEKIYPFITKIEEVIYARPHKITEEDFKKALALFSPVYYELTSQKFNLKI
ncbi:MAG: hypothetical protein R6U96_12945 [Promethearchaeia archaeon]